MLISEGWESQVNKNDYGNFAYNKGVALGLAGRDQLSYLLNHSLMQARFGAVFEPVVSTSATEIQKSGRSLVTVEDMRPGVEPAVARSSCRR